MLQSLNVLIICMHNNQNKTCVQQKKKAIKIQAEKQKNKQGL
jgi:hypothetical protein